MAVCLAAGLWGAAGALGGVAGYECKNGSSDWPLPCRDPSEAIASYQLGRPGQPASARAQGVRRVRAGARIENTEAQKVA